ncbi:aminomethyl-transferring glycine dehydrogenase subunit GcvPB [Picrophilus oshimae]|uniref:glycine dehydrogenase (aminomethyl-transferring) n=1 Tax=Picrophilus torridus (strain ATCC 700027 / DSM 9790 / JCM 10055 / NBRC 100828 / KAW 2/3) TaxID=1122961 RepID=A0A8G2FXS2_PICTO|nr:aminomethyl-transferring glycine dehydrogenase subunit GcvPB [Picrophilus oshimae]SMD31383.1 glycine dehydrogenase (decarboxylating) beta subunit [Picrophilus oshimae DSM 9789]
MYKQAYYNEPYLKDLGFNSIKGIDFDINLKRKSIKLMDYNEFDVSRHYTRLSQMNYSVDLGMYPLGSCTMKYNPKYADKISGMESFQEMHPLMNDECSQGTLKVMYLLQDYLKKISGLDYVSLQPSAGAHGEFTGILIIRKYFEDLNQLDTRMEIIIPDSAHGTNPASASMGGFDVIEVPSDENGLVDLDALNNAVSERTAAFMITNPNTLGIFDDNIMKISEIMHKNGALLYYDGANFNAILGITTPGIMGFDIVHFNLHKTFATPHGGGGPGAGPVAVRSFLKDYLPVPLVSFKNGMYYLDYNIPKTIGKVSSYYGSFSILIRALSYIIKNGNYLKERTVKAVLNSNYMSHQLSGYYKIPYKELKKHEFVLSTENTGKKALDIAKYLLDYGIHPPTTYFPLIVKEAMMIEPTESATKKDLDYYIEAMVNALKADDNDLKMAPLNTSVSRIDELKAARQLKLHW